VGERFLLSATNGEEFLAVGMRRPPGLGFIACPAVA
jgi:hypothetical protein